MYRFSFNMPHDFQRVVEYCVRHLSKLTFDVIVFRGFSGAIVGAPVALRLNKPWALVRKQGDSCHSWNNVEGRVIGEYVIVDDFVESGSTIHMIVEQVNAKNRDTGCSARCKGVMLYDEQWITNYSSSEDYNYDYWQKKLGGVAILNWNHGLTPKPVPKPAPKPVTGRITGFNVPGGLQKSIEYRKLVHLPIFQWPQALDQPVKNACYEQAL